MLKVYNPNSTDLQPLDEINDPGRLTEQLFWELACEMVDKGLFDLEINKHKISKIKKALVSETGLEGEMMTSIQYMVKDKSIWICPPLTIE